MIFCLGDLIFPRFFYIFAIVRKKGVVMLMFLACLAIVGVFVIIEIIGNAIKNTENTNDDEG